jgi:hypothetical protein
MCLIGRCWILSGSIKRLCGRIPLLRELKEEGNKPHKPPLQLTTVAAVQ